MRHDFATCTDEARQSVTGQKKITKDGRQGWTLKERGKGEEKCGTEDGMGQ